LFNFQIQLYTLVRNCAIFFIVSLLNCQNKYQYDDLLIRSQDPYANAKYEIILKWLKSSNVKTILNAGCGSGELSLILAQKGYAVTGFDLDRDYISLANKNLKKMKVKNCSFIVSGIENYKSKSQYDAVIATDVLEHIEDDIYAFKKLVSFVKPGGSVIITVPAGQYLFGFHDEQLGYFRRYSLSSFKKIIPGNLKIIQIRYFGFFLIPVSFIISKIIRKSYPVAEAGDKKKNPVVNNILNIIFNIEKSTSFPFGTSLLFRGKKRKT
jgi:2-polyprenyl-3-methyl-5-hydroxy-6-metoxy-1,4-benzoquinol methylase